MIMSGKIMNAGQVCLSPDYVFVPEAEMETFIDVARNTFQGMFPTVSGNSDYVAVVNERHYQRISGYIDEAKAAGTRVEPMSPDAYNAEEQRIPIHLVIDPAESLKVMQDEIFGPVMIVKPYKELDECINYIADHPHPLGLYYFGDDKAEQKYVLEHTQSGGVTINDVLMHISNIELPFGGVGNSGMGNYQGLEGFRTFSHARSVYTQGWVNLPKLAGTMPPYNTEKLDKLFGGQIKK
jgi:coniferyl-aldehyde dehydrogenase